MMEKSLHSRYLNSQDQLIISLNEQIEAMTPLKDSYSSLQKYHIKLLHDFQTLISEHDHVSGVYAVKFQELLAINQELDAKKNTYIDELRSLQNQKAKLTLDRKNLMSCCETLSNKYNLENQQSVLLQERTRDILQSIKKTEQNISIYRKIISQIESDIRLKTAESVQTEDEIARRIDYNRKTAQKIESTEAEIKSYSLKRQKNMTEIRSIDKSQDDLQYKIRDELRNLKELNEKILTKKDELAQLNHQKQYYTRLIQSQLVIKQDLDISEHKLNGLLERRIKQCERVDKENAQWNQKIKDQQQSIDKSCKYKDALVSHLSELVKANSILLDTMKRSCKQDQKAHHILNKKLDNLDCAIIRTSDSDTVQVAQAYKKTFALRDRTNEFTVSKKADKSASTWIKQLDMQTI